MESSVVAGQEIEKKIKGWTIHLEQCFRVAAITDDRGDELQNSNLLPMHL